MRGWIVEDETIMSGTIGFTISSVKTCCQVAEQSSLQFCLPVNKVATQLACEPQYGHVSMRRKFSVEGKVSAFWS
jgi:hypothetical protein